MAIMIPSSGPRSYQAASHEGYMYEALRKLPNDYYVVHSMGFLVPEGNVEIEGEADFVIFNKDLGILCIEAKAGRILYENGVWKYSSGILINGGEGPYQQAMDNVHLLMKLFGRQGLGGLLQKVKIHGAAWLPGVDRQYLRSMPLPPDADVRITMTKDDLDDPKETVDKILSLDVPSGKTTHLTQAEAKEILEKIICPHFQLVSSLSSNVRDSQEFDMVRLLESQKKVLDFIADESFVTIKGLSGTGKTLVASEQARRMAKDGKKVLFLCYNKLLGEELMAHLRNERGITVRTLSKLCTDYGLRYDDYTGLCEKLERFVFNGGFGYQSVVIDEAQDFGSEALSQGNFFESLQLITEEAGGSLFAFYDPNQLVQPGVIPTPLLEAETRLVLRTNCRNTRQIALCSQVAAGIEPQERIISRSVDGETPRICFVAHDYNNRIKAIENEISYLKGQGARDIVILSCGSQRKTGIGGDCDKEYDEYGRRETMSFRGVPVYTVRVFKGLEADAVILIKVDASCWEDSGDNTGEPGALIYLGASRAKRFLSIVCQLDEGECISVLKKHFDSNAERKPFRTLAKRLGANVVERWAVLSQ